jgi:translation initiation factor 1 (eIF-1/SUI1)
MPDRPGRLVYSTDDAVRRRAEAVKAPAPPPWLAGPPLPPEKQTVSIRREVKGRGGKTATVVYDLRLSEADFKDLARSSSRATTATRRRPS